MKIYKFFSEERLCFETRERDYAFFTPTSEPFPKKNYTSNTSRRTNLQMQIWWKYVIVI